jgi:predicted dithiol-disulfide oxidoreductase (DUF899 family)
MDDEIEGIEEQIRGLKKQLSEARRRRPAEPMRDYRLQTGDGEVALAELFGAKDDLIVIHNMGAGCRYCTLWADGLNSLLPHVESRSAFVVVSPDNPDAQAKFASGRGWKFRMASDADGAFTRETGYLTPDGYHNPGVSAFHRGADGQITRTGTTFFGPGDDFCAVWPLFDLLAGGDGGWEPQYRYAQ